MLATDCMTERQATVDEILRMLQADYEIRAAVDPEVDPGKTLRPDTTIAQWRGTCDLVSLHRLVPHLNDWFGADLRDGSYLAALSPEGERTLGDLCELVAPSAKVVVVQPVRVAGVSDVAVGAFFTLRTLLARAGMPANEIRPSTRFADIPTRYGRRLVSALVRLAPGSVPVPKIEHNRLLSYAWYLTILAVPVALHGALTGRALTLDVGVGGVLLGVLGVVAGFALPPRSLSVGGASTFGDLARLLVREVAA